MNVNRPEYFKRCAVKSCTNTTIKKCLFRFPKDYDRWLQWVQASGRLDLIPKGPKYAYHNCRLCHHHFEEKWYKIGERRSYLNPDAVPTIFSVQGCDNNDTTVTKDKEEDNGSMIIIPSKFFVQVCHNNDTTVSRDEEEDNGNVIIESEVPEMEIDTNNTTIKSNINVEIAGPSTSSNRSIEATSDNSPQIEKLKQINSKLRTKIKRLQNTVWRLKQKLKKEKRILSNEKKSTSC